MTRAGHVLLMLVGGACLTVACSGSTPRDQNSADAGSDFDVPLRDADIDTADVATGTAGTGGGTAGAAGGTTGAAGTSADAAGDAVSDGGAG